jgi:proteasome lid subunit RPN8/RPN11
MRSADWAAMLAELGRRGGGTRESGAFLLADRSGDRRTVTRVVYLDDLDPGCLTGGISFNGLAYSKLWDICDAEQHSVIGDAHTHPGPVVHQSRIDADNPMIASDGHVALIIPHLATRPVRAREVGVHRYDGRGRAAAVREENAVTWESADKIHRTAKILLDSGRAADPAAARSQLKAMVLQVAVGPGIRHDPAAQAALVTVVNAGHRAFLGGVHVHLLDNPVLETGWAAGLTAARAAAAYGGRAVTRLSENLPTIVIGRPQGPAGRPVLHLAWNGWAGGVVQEAGSVPAGDGTAIAGTAAAALGVSEAFQHQLGAVVAARRDVGISLWRPDLDWRAGTAAGPPLQYLPAALWLLGLGHLGQAYAWTLGMLPYAAPEQVKLGLVDFDVVVDGNTATQLLVRPDDSGHCKTRVTAAALEDRGFATRIVERAFDGRFHPDLNGAPARREPVIALAGFDDAAPRRLLGEAGLTRVVDAGLGSGPAEYLDMVVHAFPAPETPAQAFAVPAPGTQAFPAAYEDEIARQAKTGADEAALRCGMLDIAGVTVGAAFVGTFAATLAVADILRLLHDGANYSVISVDLRSPSGLRAVPNTAPGAYPSPAYTSAR